MGQGKRKEKELLIDAELFAELGRSWKKVGRVKSGLKRGEYDNELSRFRDDGVLEMGEKEEIAEPDGWVDWDEEGSWRVGVRGMLAPGLEVVAGGLGGPVAPRRRPGR